MQLIFSLVYYQRYLQHHSNFGSHALASFDVVTRKWDLSAFLHLIRIDFLSHFAL
jgi:hypothetical protein